MSYHMKNMKNHRKSTICNNNVNKRNNIIIISIKIKRNNKYEMKKKYLYKRRK